MKMLIIIVFALAGAATIGLISLDDPGLMVLSYGQRSLEIPLVLGLLLLVAAFAILYLVFNFLFGIFRAPKKAKQWNKERQNKNAQTDTLRGYARLIEGDWAQGEKELVKRLDHCKTPLLNYLGAAYAAQQQGDHAKRDEYLAKAEKIDPANRMAIDITRARMLTQAGDYIEAKTLLSDMHQHAPANKTILRLMSDVYQQTEDWDSARNLLPKLTRTKALPEDKLIELDVAVRQAGFNDAIPDKANPSALGQYRKLSGKHKKNARVAALYANRMIGEGQLAAAEGIVRKAISKNWSSELAGLYGKTRILNLRGQISLATSWLAEHEDDANVNLTLARLNFAYDQMDKARKYYNTAIELGAGDEAYYELGQFYESEGNAKMALAYYKKGMEDTISDEKAAGLTQQIIGTDSAESIIMPGAADTALVVVEKVDAEEVSPEDAQVIEHRA